MGNAGGRARNGGGPSRVRAYVGLGANVGDARGQPRRRCSRARGAAWCVARRRLAVCTPRGRSAWRRSATSTTPLSPSTCHAGPDVETGAMALLVALKGIERAFGRQARGRWGPRELDLDLLLFGGAQLSVLRPSPGVSTIQATASGCWSCRIPRRPTGSSCSAPLADLAPDLVPPGWPESIRAARDRRRAAEGPGRGSLDRPVGRRGAVWRRAPSR